MKLLSRIFFIFLLYCYSSIGATQATSYITWKIKEGSSNLSFFYNREDLKKLMPEKNESFSRQYERIFSDPAMRKAYMNVLEDIVIRKNLVTDWDEGRNKYRTNYKTPCKLGSPAAFCQEITLKISNSPSGNCLWTIGDNAPVADSCSEHSTSVEIKKDILVKVGVQNAPHRKISSLLVHVDGKVILALGDSFASGEGNPDRPTKHFDEIPREGSGHQFFLSRGEGWETAKNYEALWLDRTCHRSMLSHQFKVALQYAAENPNQRVVFASFSCSGAEIISGLLEEQTVIPYNLIFEKNPAQLESAVKFLCGDIKQNVFDDEKCSKPDLILLSIGGNDVGFGPLTLFVFSPKLDMVPFLPVPDILKFLMTISGTYITPEQANLKIKEELPKYYKELKDRLIKMKLNNIPIIQTNYPNVVANCKNDWNRDSNNNLGIFDLLFFDNKYNGLGARGAKYITDIEPPFSYFIPSFFDKAEFSISKKESEELAKQVILPLQAKVNENEDYGWNIVALDQKEVEKYGLCALDLNGSNKPEDTFKFPYRESAGVIPEWRNNEKPSEFHPYVFERQRYFNTIDDSILKMSTRNCPEFYQSGNICAEMLRGAIHPNLAYHAKIADKIYEKIKDILSPQIK